MYRRINVKKLQERLHNLTATYWQPTVYYGFLLVFFGLLSWFQLGSLVGGYSVTEAAAMQGSLSLGHIVNNPLNAPFAILAYLFDLVYTGDQPLLPVRAAATVIGLLTLTVFYWLVRHWHGERTAVLGTVVFGCSAWFLHTARLGTPDALLFLLLALVAGTVWLKKTDNPLILLGGFALAAALMYIPGMLWLMVIGAIWQAKTILRLAKTHTGYFVVGALGMMVLIAPLIWEVMQTPDTGRVVSGLPADGGLSVFAALERLAQVPYNLLVHGPASPEIWLGRLPVLDAFSIGMLVLGGYVYIRHRRLARSQMVLGAIAAGSLLIALGGLVTLSIIIPFVYILVAAGIGYLLDQWFKVFPRNTIAQAIGVALVSLAVIVVGWYGLRHYYVAWPNAPETKETFVIQ